MSGMMMTLPRMGSVRQNISVYHVIKLLFCVLTKFIPSKFKQTFLILVLDEYSHHHENFVLVIFVSIIGVS